jgi:transcriptional regulator with XRE-family HTH domain
MSQQEVPDVGAQLRTLRNQRGLSRRALAELCGLSPNTISLTERGTTSPSVSTLHRLAGALGVPATYFLTAPAKKAKVILTRSGVRSRSGNGNVVLESLARGMDEQAWYPFVVTLEPGSNNGRRVMAHSGEELVYCLAGELEYEIAGERYELEPGDALLFHADLPHSWRNANSKPAEFMLMMAGVDDRRESVDQHIRP